MNRRGFIQSLTALAGTMTLDPERLLWRPGERTVFIPPAPKLLTGIDTGFQEPFPYVYSMEITELMPMQDFIDRYMTVHAKEMGKQVDELCVEYLNTKCAIGTGYVKIGPVDS